MGPAAAAPVAAVANEAPSLRILIQVERVDRDAELVARCGNTDAAREFIKHTRGTGCLPHYQPLQLG